MWAQVVYIVLGAWDNLTRADGVVDVTGLAVVVPCRCVRILVTLCVRTAWAQGNLQVMIWTNSGLSSSMCIHRSYQSFSLAESQFFSHWGSPEQALASTPTTDTLRGRHTGVEPWGNPCHERLSTERPLVLNILVGRHVVLVCLRPSSP